MAQVTSVRYASFSRRVETYLVFLSFEVEYDKFFITVLKNVVVCMAKYYLMKAQIASALLV